MTLVIFRTNKTAITDKANSQKEINKIRKEYEDRISILGWGIKNYSSNQAPSTLTQNEIDKIADQIAHQKFDEWKREHEEEIRTDTKIRQKGKIISSIDAQMMPLLGIQWFPGKFYEARFIGNPVTYVVFKNLDDDKRDLEIEFVEITNKNIIKAGKVKRAIESGKVKYTAINRQD